MVDEFIDVLNAHLHSHTKAVGVGEKFVGVQTSKDLLNTLVPPFHVQLISFVITLAVFDDYEWRVDIDQIRHHILGLNMPIGGLLLGISHQQDHLHPNAKFGCLLA